MNEWLPVVIGFGLLAIVLAVFWVFPESTWAQEARRYVGYRPTGAYGIRTRRDRMKNAGIAAVAAPLLWALGYGAFEIGEKFNGLSKANWVAEAYMFGLAILSAMAALFGLASLLSAAIWRPKIVKRASNDIARGLLDLLEVSCSVELPRDVWPDLNAMRYTDPSLEAIRQVLVAEFPHGRPPTLKDRNRIENLATQLRTLAA